MGNFIKGLLDKFKISDDDYDDFDEEESLQAPKTERSFLGRESLSKRSPYRSSYQDNGFKSASSFEEKVTQKAEKPSKVVSLNRTPNPDLELCVIKPVGVKEINKVSDKLIEGCPVILNFEGIADDEAQRMMDFVLGTIYTIGGKFSRISSYNFVFLPKGVELNSNLDKFSSGIELDDSSFSEFEIPIIKRDF